MPSRLQNARPLRPLAFQLARTARHSRSVAVGVDAVDLLLSMDMSSSLGQSGGSMAAGYVERKVGFTGRLRSKSGREGRAFC